MGRERNEIRLCNLAFLREMRMAVSSGETRDTTHESRGPEIAGSARCDRGQIRPLDVYAVGQDVTGSNSDGKSCAFCF